jgi:beta-lactamase superfamily II metal-dependent hydrolase
MNLFTIEMLPAGYGDALWIEYGDARKPCRILIDGGLSGTYNALTRRIEEAARATGRCEIDLLVITHVDADHIEGIVKLLANPPATLHIGQVWFNGWKHLPAALGRRLGPPQGEMLTALIDGRLPWNDAFGGGAVAVDAAGAAAVPLAGGMTATVLSPTLTGLTALRPKWRAECREAGIVPGSVASGLRALEKHPRLRPRRLGATLNVSQLAASPFETDTAVANGSSIALLLEYDDRRCVLAGDAHPAVLEAALKPLCRGRRLRLDAFKLSHHGSGHNTSPDLLKMVSCGRFLFSTNGSTGHPDAETVARVIETSAVRPVELLFNHASLGEHMDGWANPGLMRDKKYVLSYPAPDTVARVEL